MQFCRLLETTLLLKDVNELFRETQQKLIVLEATKAVRDSSELARRLKEVEEQVKSSFWLMTGVGMAVGIFGFAIMIVMVRRNLSRDFF
jgi:hypothetical protein